MDGWTGRSDVRGSDNSGEEGRRHCSGLICNFSSGEFFMFIMYIVNPDVTKLFYIVVRKSTWGVAWILAAFHIVLNSS